MNEQDLMKWVNENKSIGEIAKVLNLSKSTIRYWLRKFNLKTHKLYKKHFCTICQQDDPVKFGRRKDICTTCNAKIFSKRVANWRRDTKRKLVAYKGGKCEICGFNEDYMSCYNFHHIDPSKKEFNISHPHTKGYESLLAEVDKCQLLCGNCHNKLHEQANIARWALEDKRFDPPKRKM